MTTPGDPGSLVAGKAAAGASLRETAKWLVGGVAATAAGIFAGSSLTRLGSLDFGHAPGRLGLAIGGGLAGFAALGLILTRAIRVLTVESIGLVEVAESDRPSLKQARERIEMVYAGALPGGEPNLRALLARAERTRLPGAAPDEAFLTAFAAMHPRLTAEAAFQHVSAKFAELVAALKLAGPLAILGFGLFAWAANPPEEKDPPVKQPWIVVYRR